MSDTFAAHQRRLGEFREKLRYVDGAIGAAVAVGGQVVGCDVFDKASTCEKVWDRLLSGVMLDAMELGETEKLAEPGDVAKLLQSLGGYTWEPTEPIGEGRELRAESATGDHASALLFDDVLVHGSLVCPV
jgi:hypothetical protein